MGVNKSWIRRLVETEPVVLRGAIVSILALIGLVANWNFSEGLEEPIINGVIGLFAFISSVWARSSVVPKAKVVAYLPSPNKRPGFVKPGEANDAVASGEYKPGRLRSTE